MDVQKIIMNTQHMIMDTKENILNTQALIRTTQELIISTKGLRHQTKDMHRRLDTLSIPSDVWDIMTFIYDVIYAQFKTPLNKKTQRVNKNQWFRSQGFNIWWNGDDRSDDDGTDDDSENEIDFAFWKRLGIDHKILKNVYFESYFASCNLHTFPPKMLFEWACKFQVKICHLRFNSKLYRHKDTLNIVASTMVKYATVLKCTHNIYFKNLLQILNKFPKNIVAIILHLCW